MTQWVAALILPMFYGIIGLGFIMKNINEKFTTQLFAAVTLIFIGCALLIAGFVVPPTGEIDSSVLVAFGEILTFVGALFGIDYRYRCNG